MITIILTRHPLYGINVIKNLSCSLSFVYIFKETVIRIWSNEWHYQPFSDQYSHFVPPENTKKLKISLFFSEGIKWEHWLETGWFFLEGLV